MTLTTAKWAIEDYHRMIASGVVEERHVELLNGEIVEMAPEEESHAY
jgi:Uma2 family endonuclease